jgi:hypothetical protein
MNWMSPAGRFGPWLLALDCTSKQVHIHPSLRSSALLLRYYLSHIVRTEVTARASDIASVYIKLSAKSAGFAVKLVRSM